MGPADCPLPEVASALGSFIKPRDEVTTIRRNLQAYLRKQLPGDEETVLSTVNLTTPLDENLGDPPSALTGVRKAYWKALQANQVAQTKYDALKADLEALKRPGDPASAPEPSSTSISETYVPLLRQKEKLRRLKVLEHAHSSLPSLPSEPLEDHLKSQLGPQTTPPSSHPPTSSSTQKTPEVEAKLLELKKAVLTAKRRVQDQEARNAVNKASLPPPEEMGSSAQIAGLQKALQELTVWMEEMLGVIADAEAEAAAGSVPPTPGAAANGTPDRAEKKFDLDEIEAAYERYLHARRRLVQHVASPRLDDNDGATEPLFDTPLHSSSKSAKPTTKSPPELLLPYIPALFSLKTGESALLAQKSYIWRQLSASEAETARLVQRLAGESHLVQSGASRGKEWVEASREADAETESVVLERVRVGEEWSGKAKEAVAGIEAVAGGAEGVIVGR